ncbi:MAG: Zn-ribbon domain-containing OB-fold protein [Anaerolineae bacterium]
MKLTPKTTRDLLGSRCPQCGHVAFPVESICSVCAHQGGGEPVELGPEGTLYTFTVVYAAAPGVETPYALGYVDFAAGARVFGRIVTGDNPVVGMRVRVVSDLSGDGDTFWFEPVAESEGGT